MKTCVGECVVEDPAAGCAHDVQRRVGSELADIDKGNHRFSSPSHTERGHELLKLRRGEPAFQRGRRMTRKFVPTIRERRRRAHSGSENDCDVIGEFLGLPGNNRSVTFRIMHVFEFRDDLISREQIWLDTGSIVAQLSRR